MSIPYWIESLVFSFRDSIVARVGSERTVYYHFLESTPTGWTSNNTGFTPFNENQRSFIKSAFDYFSTIIDLKFVETKTYNNFNTIVLGNNDQGGSGSAGYMTGAPGDQAWGMFISNVHPNATSLLNPQSSSWVPQTYIHELGHVLGLKHPFGNTLPVLSDAEDNFDLTVMTYGSRSPGVAAPAGIQLQPLDIAALQYLYGPSKAAANATTDNSYTLDAGGRNFIWDGGGIDRLDASSADKRLVLDLEPLTQGYFGVSPGSLISNNGQVTINRGTAIEDVSATRFDDIIFGNSLDNRFFPNGGIDSIDGRDGNDTVVLSIDSSESKLYREENALVIVSPNGSIVRLKNVETVRYKDGDRNTSDLINLPSTVSAPFYSTLNAPSGVQTDNFTITYNFNEAVSGLTTSDFSIVNGEIQSITGSGKTYVVTVAPSAAVFGVMSLQLSAAAVTAISGATNLTTPPQYFQIDTAPVKLSAVPGAATVTNSEVVLKFDDVLNLRSGEIIVRNALGAEVDRLSVSDTSRFTLKGAVLTLYLKAEVSDGSILSLNIPTGSIVDLNGNSISYTITTSASQTLKTLGTDDADTKNLGPLSDVYDGLGGNDRIWGEEGNDTIYGGSGNDRLNGMQGDDKLFGGDGDDLLLGGPGDDYFDGGSGTDTVEYGILSKDATITKTAEGYTVKTASEGTDRLKNVETIKFTDKPIALGDDPRPVKLSTAPGSAITANSTIVLKFDNFFNVMSGEIIVRNASGAEVDRLSLSDTSRFTQKDNDLYLYLKDEISDGSILSVNIPTGSIVDLNGNSTAYTIATSPSQTSKTLGTDGADTKNLGPLSDVYDGLGGDDRIWGIEGNDTIYGGSGNDRLNGMQGDDKLFGGDGDDLLLGGPGDDYFDGGPGTDTVDYSASFGILSKDATITQTAEGYTVKTALEGTDRLKGVETIKFADTLITLNNAYTSATNNAPLYSSASQSVSTSEDTAKAITVAATDADNEVLTYTISTAAARGTTVISGGTITYTPAKDYNGNDSFVVTASDGKGGTATQTVNMTVTPVNDAPTFATASQAVSATAGTAKTITLAATDVDGDALTYTVATPGKGTASISGSTLTYTPSSTASGSDSFVVTASDGKGGTATQAISATIFLTNNAPTFTDFSGAAKQWSYAGHDYAL
ncbi:MAG: tandem-95 repeat protein, partial [Burkholderiales bacterium]|nr:tandem-95 repeat protein [Burkholderiales bacterium]